ncbi:hypothetical protein [Amycolatopsis sp. cmx-4-54]|uniref:hypothetical protein n=1 Tax=Amycolatopsis sp. cmx-4-54 TaxID=2790936 RepID=UPI0039789752
MSHAHINLIALIAVSFVIRTALVAYAVVIALKGQAPTRRKTALDIVRLLSPRLSIKVGRVTIAHGEEPQENAGH